MLKKLVDPFEFIPLSFKPRLRTRSPESLSKLRNGSRANVVLKDVRLPKKYFPVLFCKKTDAVIRLAVNYGDFSRFYADLIQA